jgi:uncharacterized protein (TIGR02246 family)
VPRSRTFGRGALAIAALLVPLAAAPARAQAGIIPSQNNDLSPDVMRFRAAAMQDATLTLNNWRTAWEQDNVDQLMRLYQRDALLVLPGATTPSQGAQAIEQALQQNLPKMGNIVWRVVDAAVDDHLLYIYQRYVVEPVPGDTASEPAVQSGTATLVMQREGRNWRIRAQIFSPELPAAPATQSAAAAPTPSPVQATTDH